MIGLNDAGSLDAAGEGEGDADAEGDEADGDADDDDSDAEGDALEDGNLFFAASSYATDAVIS